MAAAEHQRTGPIEGGEQSKPAGFGRKKSQAQQGQEDRTVRRDVARQIFRAGRCWRQNGQRRQNVSPKSAPNEQHKELAERAGQRQGDAGRQQGRNPAGQVRAEAACHQPHRLGDHGDGRELQAVQGAPGERMALQRGGPMAREEHQQSGWQREAAPGGEPAEPAGALQARGKTPLGWKRGPAETGTAPEDCVFFLADPAAPVDKFTPKIAEMRDWPAERTETEQEKGPQNFACAALAGSWGDEQRSQLAATENMHMEMRHFLPAVRAGIGDHAIAALGHAQFFRHQGNRPEKARDFLSAWPWRRNP